MSLLDTRRVAALGLIALLAAACEDASGPGELSDPSAIAGEVAQVAAAVETPVFEGFEVLGDNFPAFGGAGPEFRAIRLLPSMLDAEPSARSVATARELQQLVPVFSRTSPQDTVLPDTALGTWEWDTFNDQYVKTARPGAPANTARFILYVVDTTTDLPLEPLDEVGYADLTDNQPAGPSYSLGLTVKDSTGTTTYLDYDVTVTPSVGAFTASAEGFVSNGLSGPAERRLTFSAGFTASGDETAGSVSADATITLNVLGIRVEVHDDVTFAGSTVTFIRDFLFQRLGETIRVQGTITITEIALGEYSITVDVTVRVNGRVFATVEGTYPDITATGPGGRQLTVDEAEALTALLDAGDGAYDVLEDLLDPIEEVTPSSS